ncbi:cardiolipin synthase [Thalassobacillus hwangdonensis]|uniref:Cardiolipin synthase n=1 Tax=Thalassobacillus hwangdonensis TaxID=546108 RepID=A0ABW3L4X1_9BACI
MEIVLFVITCLFILFILALLDFKLGRLNHRKTTNSLRFPRKRGYAQFYQHGSALFEAMFQDIREAEKQIDTLFFIVKKDEISQRYFQLLEDKAKSGVVVRLLVDRAGGFRLGKKIIHQLKEAGVLFHFVEKPRFPFFIYKLNRRNHRKITIIDGKIGYVGGFNVAKEYIGRESRFGNWRDYHLRLTGSIVADLEAVFRCDWFTTTKQQFGPLADENAGGKMEIRVIPTDGFELEGEFLKMIREAKKSIRIGSPYFIPSRALMDELKLALQRNVSITLLCPLKSDHPLVKEAGIPYMEELYRAGGNVHWFSNGFYHSKVFAVDDAFCDIGTANFDRRSLFLNKEVNTIIFDQTFVQEVTAAFMEDVRDSIPFDDKWLKNRSLQTKINEQIARLFRGLL